VSAAWLRALAARARAGAQAFALRVWSLDHDRVGRGRAFGNSVLRVATWTARGAVRDRVSLQAAALTYYTVFSIVPVLVVALWILKTLGRIPMITDSIPAAPAEALEGNAMLGQAVRHILLAVDRSGARTGGIVGLGALLYGVVRLFSHAARALDDIAAPGEARRSRAWRLLGYAALVILPPVALALWGLAVAVAHGLIDGIDGIGHFHHFLRVIARAKVAAGSVMSLGTLWLALATFYWGATERRIPFSSASVGAAASALALVIVLWAFAEFQIGVTRASAVGSGLAALPVFMLWAFSSWMVVLVGAEIAVGHAVDRALVRAPPERRAELIGRIGQPIR
jgi:membrane protein